MYAYIYTPLTHLRGAWAVYGGYIYPAAASHAGPAFGSGLGLGLFGARVGARDGSEVWRELKVEFGAGRVRGTGL